ncbi:MAG: adenosylmethionine decarboxylase [Acidobacteriota bacterium]|nr:adenosylmethionine decarboxylase [Acidobacteriota bacterium]
MNTTGRHLLVEYSGCDAGILNDPKGLEALMKRGVVAARATTLGTIFRRFAPQGVSGVVVLEESHFSIHTWPEYGYAAVDFYTCGDCIPDEAHRILREGLGASASEVMAIDRGQNPPGPSIRIARHKHERTGDARGSLLEPRQPMPSAV